MRSCLDKFYDRFLLWGGKRFSFSFYSLPIAKVILQWLISTFFPGLLNHPVLSKPEQVSKNRAFPSALPPNTPRRSFAYPHLCGAQKWEGGESPPNRIALLPKHFLFDHKSSCLGSLRFDLHCVIHEPHIVLLQKYFHWIIFKAKKVKHASETSFSLNSWVMKFTVEKITWIKLWSLSHKPVSSVFV